MKGEAAARRITLAQNCSRSEVRKPCHACPKQGLCHKGWKFFCGRTWLSLAKSLAEAGVLGNTDDFEIVEVRPKAPPDASTELAAVSEKLLVADMLFGLSPSELSTITTACLLLLAVAFVAGYLPARSASSILTLRTE